MSTARDRMANVLRQHVGCRLSEDHVNQLTYQLMPTVRDAIARGFENAAEEITVLADNEPPSVIAELLRGWANQARTAGVTQPLEV